MYVLEPVPNLEGGQDWAAEGRGCGSGCWNSCGTTATPPTSSPRPSSRQRTGPRRAWPQGRRSAWRTPSARRARSDPPTWSGDAQGVPGGHGHNTRSRHPDGADQRRAGRATRAPLSGSDPVSTALERGYAQCARLTRAHGTTYFWGAVLLPRPRRRHVHAVYALCRLADDIVDAPGATLGDTAATRAALTDFRARFEAVLAGTPCRVTMCSPRSPTPSAPAASPTTASTGSSTPWPWISM
nr:squalene/phytoene synthase family protein [Tessaracoccus coleopterorum]